MYLFSFSLQKLPHAQVTKIFHFQMHRFNSLSDCLHDTTPTALVFTKSSGDILENEKMRPFKTSNIQSVYTLCFFIFYLLIPVLKE